MNSKLTPNYSENADVSWVDSISLSLSRFRRVARQLLFAGLAGLILFLALYRINVYPSPTMMPGYIDDAQHLLAAERIAFQGKYVFGPAVGPTILLPVAWVLSLFGTGQLAPHLLMVAFLLANIFLFYLLVRKLGDWKVGMLATFIYVVAPGINLIWLGRLVLGEVPSMMYLFGGILVWYKAIDEMRQTRRTVELLLVGLLIGLTILTKNQALIVLAAWFVIWFLNVVYYRQAQNQDFFIPAFVALLVIGAWFGYQMFLLPNSQQIQGINQSQWSGAASRGLLTFNKNQMVDAIKFLTDSATLFSLAIPGCLYAIFRSLQRSREGLRWSLLTVIAVGWLSWFTFFSVGWPRYAYQGLTLAAIFVAFFFYDVTNKLQVPIRKLSTLVNGSWDTILVGETVLAGLLLVLGARSLVGRLTEVVVPGCDTHLQMTQFVQQHVPISATIETYDPEVCFLSGHACHLPPGEIQDAIVRYVWYGGIQPSKIYPPTAPYILIGITGYYAGLYDTSIIDQNYNLVASYGVEYPCRLDLYQAKGNSQ